MSEIDGAMYIACFCLDNEHAMHERAQRFDDMGRYVGPLWRQTHEEAANDGLFVGGDQHVILRLSEPVERVAS